MEVAETNDLHGGAGHLTEGLRAIVDGGQCAFYIGQELLAVHRKGDLAVLLIKEFDAEFFF